MNILFIFFIENIYEISHSWIILFYIKIVWAKIILINLISKWELLKIKFKLKRKKNLIFENGYNWWMLWFIWGW